MVYVYGEGSPEENYKLFAAADNNMANLAMVDCIVDHPDVILDGMLSHSAVAPHLGGADTVIVDVMTNFASESVRRHTIRKLMAPFHALARKGVTTFLALHPNRYRNVRRPADRIPAGWAGSAEVAWLIEPSDDQGHAVLEMVRGRYYPKPWPRYEFWLDQNAGGVRVAVIGQESKLSIADLLAEKNPKHVPPSVAAAKAWLLRYLAEHGPSLVETESSPPARSRGTASRPSPRPRPSAAARSSTRRRAQGRHVGSSRRSHLHSRTIPLSPFPMPTMMNRINGVGRSTNALSPIGKSWPRRTRFLGIAALDPASPAVPVHVRTLRHYAIELGQDGRSLPWAIPDDGRSWLWFNGPWGEGKGKRSELPEWSVKFCNEHSCGNVPRSVSLWPYSPDADWYKSLMKLPHIQETRITRKGLKFGNAKNGPSTNLKVLAYLTVGLRLEEVAALRESLGCHGVDVVPEPNVAAPLAAKPVTYEPLAGLSCDGKATLGRLMLTPQMVAQIEKASTEEQILAATGLTVEEFRGSQNPILLAARVRLAWPQPTNEEPKRE